VNVAYVVYSGELTPAFSAMLESLGRQCDCRLVLAAHRLTDAFEREVRSRFTGAIEFRALSDAQWVGQRMARKIWELRRVSFDEGDRVFVLDTDLLIQADIFDALDGTFDVGITSRHYDYWYPINGGVWAFQFNDTGKRFLEFFASQIENPTWPPFVAFQERFDGRRPVMPQKNRDWWCDQDFLCTIRDHPLPFACRIRDLGHTYNFCPSVEDDIPGTFESARDAILERVGDARIKVLHFKGRLKEVLGSLA
jgi:hypothetical protein